MYDNNGVGELGSAIVGSVLMLMCMSIAPAALPFAFLSVMAGYLVWATYSLNQRYFLWPRIIMAWVCIVAGFAAMIIASIHIYNNFI